MNTLARPLESTVLSRWWPFFALAAIVASVSALVAYRGGFSVEAIRQVIRLTAQMSLVLFLTAFSASSLHHFWPNALTRFLLRARRQIGLSFAFSHGVHALALFTFSRIDPTGFSRATDPVMFIVGGTGYVFIVAMAVTSFDRTAAWLGPRRWKALHMIAGHAIWLAFLAAEGKRAVHDAYYWPFIAMLIIVMALRLASRHARAPLRSI